MDRRPQGSSDPAATIAARRAINRARYQRQFARNQPAPVSNHYPAGLRLTPRQRANTLLQGVPEWLQQVVRMTYGAKGMWGHGRYVNGTKKGPGRRRVPLAEQNHPTGTKLVRRFIRASAGENVPYRRTYAALAGKQYGEEE